MNHLQGFIIANNNYYSDYAEILLKEHLSTSLSFYLSHIGASILWQKCTGMQFQSNFFRNNHSIIYFSDFLCKVS